MEARHLRPGMVTHAGYLAKQVSIDYPRGSRVHVLWWKQGGSSWSTYEPNEDVEMYVDLIEADELPPNPPGFFNRLASFTSSLFRGII